MAMVDVDDSSHRQTHSPSHLALSLHLTYEPGELSQWRYAMMTAP